MSDFIPTIIFTIIGAVVAYFTGVFRGKSKVKELKLENQVKKKIIEQEEKVEQKNQEREALYDKVRVPNRRALQKRPTSRTARFTATHPKPVA